MKSYAMNFGTNNRFWNEARSRNLVLMYEGTSAWEYIQTGRVEELKALYDQDHFEGTGARQSPGWLTRWVRLSQIFREPEPTRVLHSADGYMWWTETTGEWSDLGIKDVPYKYDPKKTDKSRMIARATSRSWSNKSVAGKPLALKDLHPMVESIISLQGTMRPCSARFSAYIEAVLYDRDLSSWERQSDWRRKSAEGLKRTKNKNPSRDIIRDLVAPSDFVPEDEEERLNPSGHVYIMALKKGYPGVFKVGRSKDVEARKKQLQAGVPEALEILYTAPFESCAWGEYAVHEMIGRHKRVSGEWFEEEIDRIVAFITKAQERDADEFGSVELDV